MSGSAQVGHLYNNNRIGPKTDPWGILDVTEIWDEVSPSSATHCMRPNRKNLIQFRVYDVTPY